MYGMMNILPICAILPLLRCGHGIKVIYADRENPQPDGFAEILNSSLAEYPEFSLCGRLLTYYFSVEQTNWQVAISVGKRNILSSHAALPCDHNYQADCSTRAPRSTFHIAQASFRMP